MFPNIPLSSFFFPMPRARPSTAGQQGRRAGPSLGARQDRAGQAGQPAVWVTSKLRVHGKTNEDTDKVGNSTQACQGHRDPGHLDNQRPALSWEQPVSEERTLQGDQVGAQQSLRGEKKSIGARDTGRLR